MEQVDQLLRAVRGAVEPLSRDRRLAQWQQINFDKHELLFKNYGLQDDYKKARDRAMVSIREILHELARLDNEYGDLAIDLRRQATNPTAAFKVATSIKQQGELLEPMLRDLEANCRILFQGQEQLYRLFSLPGLLPSAKQNSRLEPEELDQGLRFFLFVTREETKSGASSLATCQEQATRLEQKLKKLDFENLPPMAVNLLEPYRQIGLTAADQLKAYIERFRKYPPNEIKALEDFRQHLKELRRGDTALLLDALPKVCARYSSVLFDLANRARSLRTVSLIGPFLGKLDLLHRALTQLPEIIKEQLRDPASGLNPDQLAADQAADFFMGMRGMVLSFKMLFQSLGGQKALTAIELQTKTVEVLNSCPSIANHTEMQRTRMQGFLEEALVDFAKPFPFELLAGHLRKNLQTFGRRLEHLIDQHPVQDITSKVAAPEEAGDSDHTLGRLVAKLEIWSERLEST